VAHSAQFRGLSRLTRPLGDLCQTSTG